MEVISYNINITITRQRAYSQTYILYREFSTNVLRKRLATRPPQTAKTLSLLSTHVCWRQQTIYWYACNIPISWHSNHIQSHISSFISYARIYSLPSLRISPFRLEYITFCSLASIPVSLSITYVARCLFFHVHSSSLNLIPCRQTTNLSRSERIACALYNAYKERHPYWISNRSIVLPW